MCGRFSATFDLPAAAAFYDALIDDGADAWQPNEDIRPSQLAPVIVLESGQRLIRLYQWGLIPSWAKDRRIARNTFNARAETLHEKPAFRSAFRKKRCLVLADAFFEWKKSPRRQKGAPPVRITVRDKKFFSFAGLWECWSEQGNAPIHTFTVITTSANAALAAVHHRMPIILNPAQATRWLNPEPAETTQPLLTPNMEDVHLIVQEPLDNNPQVDLFNVQEST